MVMNNNEKKQENNDRGMMKYGLMMMLCCLIPIVIILGLPLFGFKGGLSAGIIFLLCPLMHIGMMFMMRKNGKNESCHSSHFNEEKRIMNDN